MVVAWRLVGNRCWPHPRERMSLLPPLLFFRRPVSIVASSGVCVLLFWFFSVTVDEAARRRRPLLLLPRRYDDAWCVVVPPASVARRAPTTANDRVFPLGRHGRTNNRTALGGRDAALSCLLNSLAAAACARAPRPLQRGPSLYYVAADPPTFSPRAAAACCCCCSLYRCHAVIAACVRGRRDAAGSAREHRRPRLRLDDRRRQQRVPSNLSSVLLPLKILQVQPALGRAARSQTGNPRRLRMNGDETYCTDRSSGVRDRPLAAGAPPCRLEIPVCLRQVKLRLLLCHNVLPRAPLLAFRRCSQQTHLRSPNPGGLHGCGGGERWAISVSAGLACNNEDQSLAGRRSLSPSQVS